METSWDSVSMSGGAAAFSLNGSKFGCKIYFDETATASPIGPPPPPISASSGSGKKGRVNPGSHPPCCQVEGCELDLSNAKLYYSKHKVCPTHSKSPKVIVGGLHRRFCQQCSRFHPLPEFDQGKRSCRRRLAGHNKRRRKPPSGSFLPSCYGSDSGCGGIMLDFTAYSRTSLKDSWQIPRPKECEPATRSTAPHQRLNNSGNPHPSHVLLQSSAARVGFSSYVNPPGECYPGDADFRRALSLLSSQPLGYGNKDAGTGSNGMISSEGQPMAQQKMPHAAVTVKGHESCSSSSAMPSNLSINQFSDRAVPLQPHMEVDYFKACDGTTQHMNWPL